MTRFILTAAVCFAMVTGYAAENLYPDPGFEQTGVAGEARTGERAGHLAVKARTHWSALGGPLPVVPYATYRATAWAKARVGEGGVQALYCYHWDSYIWAFDVSTSVPSGKDWTQVSVVFRSPTDSIDFHPLAVFDTSNTEAWIDDLVVEQVMTPQETIAALEAKGALQDDDARLLGRWYAEHDQFAEAEKVLHGASDHRVRADLAYVIATAAEDPALRKRMFMEMIANNALSINAGIQRLSQVALALDPRAPLGAVVDILPAYAEHPDVLAHFASFVDAFRKTHWTAIPAPVGTRRDELASFKDNLAQARGALDGTDVLKKLDAIAAEWAAELDAAAAALGACTITIAGKPLSSDTHVIVAPAEPTPSEQTAALDLQMHLERITGQEIPVISTPPAGGKACISVGKNAFTDSLKLDTDYEALGEEGIRIATKGPHVVLTGNTRGVLYAVYVFLEDHLGCRWFTTDCATWPMEDRVDVGPLDITYVPPFEYRDTDYPKCRPPEFGVRNRLNGMYSQATPAWGGKVDYRGFVHTFQHLVPPEKYFAQHPEYYSEIGGQRVHEHAQLCLTNPEVLRIATESVLRWIDESPGASIISVSQNDNRGYCTCAKCAALAEKEGSESGPMLHFVNAIADVVAKKHPHIIIDTLAYQYTRKPPKHVKPRPNVAVRLCSIECEFNRPLATSDFNKTFVDDIKGWNKICNRLHIWDYVINYAHCVQPFPNFYVLQPNIQFFRDNGVTGIYEEANYFSRGGEFAELRTYIMAKLLWDPEYDVDTAIDEFCRAYYGKAWHLIRGYIDDTHRLAVSDPAFHMPIWAQQDGPFQTDEALAFYRDLFDRAEALVQDDLVLLHRVQVARLPIIYTQLARGAAALYTLTDDALEPAASSVNASALAKRFETIAKKEGLTRVSEGSGGDDLLEPWLKQVNKPVETLPVIRVKNPVIEAVIVPGLGGRMLSLKTSGGEAMMVTTQDGLVAPRTGGYKEFSEFAFRSPGWIEPYSVVEKGPRFVAVEAALSNGFKIRRRYEVDAAKPILRISSTLTNTTEAAKSTCLRVHPCFHLEDTAAAGLRLGTGPEAQFHPLNPGADRERELTFLAKNIAGGEWAFSDPASARTVVSRFNPDQVETCYFNWKGPHKRANLELWSKKQELAPGASLTLAHEYEIVEH